MERVVIFVDGSYLYYNSKRMMPGKRIDFFKLVNVLARNRKLVKSFFYSAVKVPPLPTQARFHHTLESLGFKVISIPLKRRGDLFVEKGVDLALAVDLLALAYNGVYDTAILVSGDGDFARVVSEVTRLGKRVEVVSFQDSIAQELKKSADMFLSIEKIFPQIELPIQ